MPAHYAINPFNGERLPIWVSNYILHEYGTGAVMSVPAHDERDFEFAHKHSLPIPTVVRPDDGSYEVVGAEWNSTYSEYGTLISSGPFTGLTSLAAIDAIAAVIRPRGTFHAVLFQPSVARGAALAGDRRAPTWGEARLLVRRDGLAPRRGCALLDGLSTDLCVDEAGHTLSRSRWNRRGFDRSKVTFTPAPS